MKTLLFISAICVTTFCSAQETEEKQIIEKGTWNITGNASLSFQKNTFDFNETQNSTENTLTSFLIAPSFGYALKNNLVAGVGLQYINQKIEASATGFDDTANYKSTSNSVGLTPYLRGYKGVGKQLALYLQGEVGYKRFWGINEQNGESENNDSNGNNLFIGVRPGITYFLGKKLAMEVTYGSLGYSFTERKHDDGNYSKNNSFNLNLNTSDLLFGLAYYF